MYLYIQNNNDKVQADMKKDLSTQQVNDNIKFVFNFYKKIKNIMSFNKLYINYLFYFSVFVRSLDETYLTKWEKQTLLS